MTLHSYRVRWKEAEPDPRYDDLARKQTAAKAITVPTLTLHGDDDRVVMPASSVGKDAHFTGGYVRQLLPGVGHFPTREAPDQVCQALEKFLMTFARG